MNTLVIGDGPLTVEALTSIARAGAKVELSASARERMKAARSLVETWVRQGRAVYGVTTGFGALCDVAIAP